MYVALWNRARCKDGAWFCDNQIAFFLRWFLIENPPPLEPQNHFSTHFYTRPTEGGVFNHRNVRRWTRRVDIFATSLVTIPIEIGAHWSLIILANLGMLGRADCEFQPAIYSIDPLGMEERGIVRKIKKYLKEEWVAKKGDSPCPMDLSALPVVYPEATRQNNYGDCGVYTGVVYLGMAITRGRLKPDFSFRMPEADSAAVEYAPGEYTRAGIVAIRREMAALMSQLGMEHHRPTVPVPVIDPIQ